MSVYDRGKGASLRWLCDFTMGGQRVNQTLHGARTKTEARAAEAKLKAEYRARLNRSGGLVRITFETAIQRYLAEVLKPKSKPAAMDRYLSSLGLLRAYFGPTLPVTEITKAKIAEWWAHELARGTRSGDRQALPDATEGGLGVRP